MKRIAQLALLAIIGAGLLAATPPPEPRAPDPRRSWREDLAPGRFLVATRKLHGPFFTQSVVLLLEYSKSGAVGLLLNRPTDVPLVELLPELEKLAERKDRVFVGGPVDPKLMVFLIRAAEPPPEAERVVDDVFATGSAEALRQVVREGAPPSRFHAYVGYAGWAPGQLDWEVERGDWYVSPAEADLIFDDALPDLWRRLVQQHEGVHVRRQTSPGSARRAWAGPSYRRGAESE
jgi:putative transcriptional regulator